MPSSRSRARVLVAGEPQLRRRLVGGGGGEGGGAGQRRGAVHRRVRAAQDDPRRRRRAAPAELVLVARRVELVGLWPRAAAPRQPRVGGAPHISSPRTPATWRGPSSSRATWHRCSSRPTRHVAARRRLRHVAMRAPSIRPPRARSPHTCSANFGPITSDSTRCSRGDSRGRGWSTCRAPSTTRAARRRGRGTTIPIDDRSARSCGTCRTARGSRSSASRRRTGWGSIADRSPMRACSRSTWCFCCRCCALVGPGTAPARAVAVVIRWRRRRW